MPEQYFYFKLAKDTPVTVGATKLTVPAGSEVFFDALTPRLYRWSATREMSFTSKGKAVTVPASWLVRFDEQGSRAGPHGGEVGAAGQRDDRTALYSAHQQAGRRKGRGMTASEEGGQEGEALRRSEERYRTLFESARDAIVIVRDGLIVDCNRQALTLFGFPSLRETIGLPGGRPAHRGRAPSAPPRTRLPPAAWPPPCGASRSASSGASCGTTGPSWTWTSP